MIIMRSLKPFWSRWRKFMPANPRLKRNRPALNNHQVKTKAAKVISYATLGMVLLGVLALFSAQAQRYGGRGFGRSSSYLNPERVQEQQQMEKALNPEFQEDVFTFARL